MVVDCPGAVGCVAVGVVGVTTFGWPLRLRDLPPVPPADAGAPNVSKLVGVAGDSFVPIAIGLRPSSNAGPTNL